MKLRLLNTSHSALAYPSYLAGHRSVDGAMSDPMISKFVADYMEEVSPSCLPVPGVDIADYKKTLVQRFGNPGVKYPDPNPDPNPNPNIEASKIRFSVLQRTAAQKSAIRWSQLSSRTLLQGERLHVSLKPWRHIFLT